MARSPSAAATTAARGSVASSSCSLAPAFALRRLLNGRGVGLGQVTWGRGLAVIKSGKAVDRGVALRDSLRGGRREFTDRGGAGFQAVRAEGRFGAPQAADGGTLGGQGWGGDGKEESPRLREESAP